MSAIARIVAALHENHCPTAEELEQLLAHRQESIGLLLPIWQAACQADGLPLDQDIAVHALFILAGLEEPAALAPLLQMLQKPDDTLDEYWGDMFMDCLPWAVARLARQSPTPVLERIADQTLSTQVRAMLVRGYLMRGALWPECREQTVATAKDLVAQAFAADDIGDDWLMELRWSITWLGFNELRSALLDPIRSRRDRELFAMELDEEYASALPIAELAPPDLAAFYRRYSHQLAWNDPRLVAIREAAEDLWPASAGSAEADEADDLETVEGPAEPARDRDWIDNNRGQPSPPQANIGRNDPCPCGSSRKYKKCCLAADDLTVLERLLPLVGIAQAPTELRARIQAATQSKDQHQPRQFLQQLIAQPDNPAKAAAATAAQRDLVWERLAALWRAADSRHPQGQT